MTVMKRKKVTTFTTMKVDITKENMQQQTKQNGFIDIEVLLGLALIGGIFSIILIPIIATISGFGFPDSGEHVGYVTAVEQGGFGNNYTAYIKTELESSQEDTYCVKDLDVVQELRDKARSKENVIIHYSRG